MERSEQVNRVTERVIGAAMRVHTALGPGLLESAYEACLAYELEQQGMRVERQRRFRLFIAVSGLTVATA